MRWLRTYVPIILALCVIFVFWAMLPHYRGEPVYSYYPVHALMVPYEEPRVSRMSDLTAGRPQKLSRLVLRVAPCSPEVFRYEVPQEYG